MYIGSYQLGDRLPVSVLCQDGDGLPTLPDAAPHVSFYKSAGGPVMTAAVPPADERAARGLFASSVHLDERFAAGSYVAEYSYTLSGSAVVSTDVFTVLPNGDPGGSVIAVYHYHRPHAVFLVQQLDTGRLVKGRNPSVA